MSKIVFKCIFDHFKNQNHFWEKFSLHISKMSDKVKDHFWKDFSSHILKMALKTILHMLMTEKIAFEVRPKKGKKLPKVLLLSKKK